MRFLFVIFCASVFSNETSSQLGIKEQIGFLLRSEGVERGVELYQKHHQQLQAHDFELLEQMAILTLEKASHEDVLEKQLLSIFGLKIAGVSSSIDLIGILEKGIKTSHLEIQLLSIQFLGQLQDDRSEELLTKAMSSPFFLARMEAAVQLTERKARKAVGQIEALMHKVPAPFRAYFPPFFAQIGTSEAIGVLKHLIDDPDVHVRIASLLSASFSARDDLLPLIRQHMTHANTAEKEACVTALGVLGDSHSIPLIKKCAAASSPFLRLAALRALYTLGDESAKEEIISMAREKNLFAIAMLSEIPSTEDLLAELMKDDQIQVRFNAAISLLRHRDPRSLKTIQEILIKDTRDLGFQPQFSVGGSLSALKIIPSSKQHEKMSPYDMQAMTLSIKETVLRECLELPEEVFLKLAEIIFKSSQTELIPLLISLLENKSTPQAIQLLKQNVQKSAAPLVRGYCILSLFRLKEEGPYEQMLYDSLEQKKLIRFRPLLPRTSHFKDASFELTPEESSRLLIDSYAAIADRHEHKSIGILLNALKNSNPKNRPIIAGLLLRAIQ
jgi:HEAT repeat protein